MRVTFVRGPRRVVDGDSLPLGGVYGLVHAVPGDAEVLLSGLSDDDGDEDEVEDGLMSVVTGGLVLVIVAVVVGVDEWLAVAVNDGSTKFSGACCGSLNWRPRNIAPATTMAITARPAMLAPTTAGVW